MLFGVPTGAPGRRPAPLAEQVFQEGFGRPWDATREFAFRASVSPTPEI